MTYLFAYLLLSAGFLCGWIAAAMVIRERETRP